MTTRLNQHTSKSARYLAMVLLLLSNLAFAQDPMESKTKTSQLEELKGFTQTFFYSRGQQKRAEKIAGFMENAAAYFQKEIGFTPRTVLYILAPQHWKDFAAEPFQDVYGFPHNPDNINLVIAAEDNPFWQSFLPPVEKLPSPMATAVTEAYSRPDGSYSMMPFFDLLALHEMGHSYHSQAGLQMQRNWMNELFVNIMLHTYIAENQPELLPALVTFPNMVVGAGASEYRYTSLEDFERLYPSMGMDPKNYGWYQSRLHSAASDIYNLGGKDVLRKLWIALEKYQEVMPDEALAKMLHQEVHPSVANVYLNWNESD